MFATVNCQTTYDIPLMPGFGLLLSVTEQQPSADGSHGLYVMLYMAYMLYMADMLYMAYMFYMAYMLSQ